MADETSLVLIDEFQKIKIYYDKNKESFIGKNPDTKQEYSGRYLFEIKDKITNDGWVADNSKKGFIVEGVFNDEIYSIQSTMVNTRTGQVRWKKMKATGGGYHVGEDWPKWRSDDTVYPVTPGNIEIWKDVVVKQSEFNNARTALINAVGRLSMKDK